ncbi:hypothetical protein NPS53_08660 [Pseudomonas putida]|uniref:hypothetical protein n=1 Tax=Pseudomonas putida TaxID=303 RepID=UPI002363CDB5|nr:hypothetical protein [Pseudomonas putida]MDD2139644.1 hypothetical protein [Pseudomonas putida]HDS1721567.1 hypothetical protein [Pseudomonas putida]
MIKLDQKRLYVELPANLVRDLLADLVTRYESFFTFGEPVYPDGQPELLYNVLSNGYDLQPCDESVGVEVIDLRAERVVANSAPKEQWKDVFAGRILAATFASTINRP